VYYSFKGERPVSWEDFPDRIRLSSGFTRTDKTTFTEDEILDAGYAPVDDPPEIVDLNRNYLDWDETTRSWLIAQYDYQSRLNEVNIYKSNLLKIIDKCIENYDRDIRAGIVPNYNLDELKNYIVQLEAIDQQENYPYLVIYPVDFKIKGLSTHGES